MDKDLAKFYEDSAQKSFGYCLLTDEFEEAVARAGTRPYDEVSVRELSDRSIDFILKEFDLDE